MQPNIIVLALCLFVTLCSACVRHSDCSNSTVAGYCLRVKCIPLSTEFPLNPTVATSNLTLSFIKQLINQSPLPLHLRRSTLRRIISLSAELNVNERLYRKIHRRSVLRVFRRLIHRQTEETSSIDFHNSVQNAMASFHDLHFQYFPPLPLRLAVATLGFTVSHYFPQPNSLRPKYIVSDFVPGFKFPSCLVKNVHVLKVDGVPIHRVIKRLGESTYGSNDAAKFRMALDALTIRQPSQDQLPKREYVRITTRSQSTGKICTSKIPWAFSLSGFVALSPSSKAIADGLPNVNRFRTKLSPVHTLDDPRRTYINVSAPHDMYISASIAHTSRGDIGVLKVIGFPLRPDNETIGEFTRVLKAMPQNGLVIDARDNLGGAASQCAMLTNLISNVSIPPLPMTLRASKLVSDVLNTPTTDQNAMEVLGRMRTGIESAMDAGEFYTGPVSNVFRATSLDEYGPLEQVYHGPVVTLTSALTYSAGDVFSLMQKDLNASYVIGVDETTGGGGAGFVSLVMTNSSYPSLFNKPFAPGAELFLSMLRYYRAGKKTGGLVEHFGIEPHERYWKTRTDVLGSDKDLFDFVAQKLGF